MRLCLITDEEHQRTKERWDHAKQEFKKHMKNYKFKDALDCIELFLGGCKVPDFVVEALMNKAKCCFKAWCDKRMYI